MPGRIVYCGTIGMGHAVGTLIDAARIDGASEFEILTRVVLPLSKAVLAVIALFYGVGYWNAFFGAMLYLDNPQMWPVQLVLRQYVLQFEPLPGTVTETKAALDAGKKAGFGTIVSARSGETEDVTIVHLAVGWDAGQFKVGSFSRSERMAKWNEMLRVEEALGADAIYAGEAALGLRKAG